ncbi:MAG: glycosyltransferase family 4 protein [Thermosphaera sp.]|nr:glycosyltransferase family 4 protein [Thermosphaera aggregans]
MINTMVMGPGGSEYVTIETAIAFAKKGFEAYIDSWTLRKPEDLLRITGFFGIWVDELENYDIGLGEPPGKPVLTVNTSGDAISGIGDVIYFHYPSLMPHDTYYPGVKGIGRIVGKAYSLINAVAFPFVFRRAKAFVANSSFTARFLRRYYGIKPLIIHPPANLKPLLIQEPLGFYERKPYVLTVSRISPEKKPERAVELASLLKKKKIGVKVVLAGSLSEYNNDLYRNLKNTISSEGLEESLEIFPNAPRSELLKLYRESLLYIHLTPREHFGISIVEAMAAGTPVITPIDSGGWSDIGNYNPDIVKPYETLEEAVEIISRLAGNKEEWEKLSRNARTRSFFFDRETFHFKVYQALRKYIYYG